MKLLLDFFPILLFFGAYKMADIYTATAVLMGATVLQTAIIYRMDGKLQAARVRAEVAAEVAAIGHVGLATVLVGDDPASHVYIEAKHRAAGEAGIATRDVRLPAETSQDDVLRRFAGATTEGARLFLGHSERLGPTSAPFFDRGGVTSYIRNAKPAPAA